MLLWKLRLQVWQTNDTFRRKSGIMSPDFYIYLVLLSTKNFVSDCSSGHALTNWLAFAVKKTKLYSQSLKAKLQKKKFSKNFFSAVISSGNVESCSDNPDKTKKFWPTFRNFFAHISFLTFSLKKISWEYTSEHVDWNLEHLFSFVKKTTNFIENFRNVWNKNENT